MLNSAQGNGAGPLRMALHLAQVPGGSHAQTLEKRWRVLWDVTAFAFPYGAPRPVHQLQVIVQIKAQSVGVGILRGFDRRHQKNFDCPGIPPIPSPGQRVDPNMMCADCDSVLLWISATSSASFTSHSWRYTSPTMGMPAGMTIPGPAPSTRACQEPSTLISMFSALADLVFSPKYQTFPYTSCAWQSMVSSVISPSTLATSVTTTTGTPRICVF